MQSNLTREQAIALAETGWWKDKDPDFIVRFQLFEAKMCMDFGDFHEATENALGRPVWTHEFADAGLLQQEFLGERPAPTFQEILEQIPEAKRIVVAIDEEA